MSKSIDLIDLRRNPCDVPYGVLAMHPAQHTIDGPYDIHESQLPPPHSWINTSIDGCVFPEELKAAIVPPRVAPEIFRQTGDDPSNEGLKHGQCGYIKKKVSKKDSFLSSDRRLSCSDGGI